MALLHFKFKLTRGPYRAPFFLILLLYSSVTNASGVENAAFYVSPTLVDFNYEEFNSQGSSLNRENGPLVGTEVSAFKSIGQTAVQFKANYLLNTVSYYGATSGGNWKSTHTKEKILNMSFTVSQNWHRKRLAYWLDTKLGYRWWRRDILSKDNVLGLLEDYHWPYIGVGAGASASLANTRFQFQLNYYYAIYQYIVVDFKNSSPTVDFPLGKTDGIGLELSTQFLNIKSSPILTMYTQFWRSDESDYHSIPGTTQSVYEPKSLTLIYGIRIGWQLN